MSDPRPPSDLAGLDARIKEAEARRAKSGKAADERAKGLSLAMRISTELVAGVAVGVGIGWFLDRWLGTKPWLLVLFFVLGCVAGMWSVYRTVSGIGHGVGLRPAKGTKPGAAGPNAAEANAAETKTTGETAPDRRGGVGGT